MATEKEKLTWMVGGALAVVFIGIIAVLLLMPAAEAPPGAAPSSGTEAAADASSAPSDAGVAAAPDAAPAEQAAAATSEFALADVELPDVRRKLKTIALAFHNFHDSRKSFSPRGRNNTEPQLSWRVFLLPYLEQMPLYRRFKLDEPWDSPNNLELVQYMPEIFRSGNDNSETTRFVVMAGDHALFRHDRPTSFRDCVDGTSNTILVMHAGGASAVPWTKPEDVEFDPQNPLQGVAPLGENFEMAMADGAVLSLPSIAGPEIFSALVTPRGGEIIDAGGLRGGRIPSITGRTPVAPLAAVEPRRSRPRPPDPRKAAEEAARAALATVPMSDVAPEEFSLERPGYNFAYDESTGHLLVVEQDQNQVSLYGLDGGLNLIATAPAPARPISVAAKQFKGRSYFAVGGKLDSRLELFDAKDATSVGTLNVQSPSVIQLGGSRAEDDPYVYYATRDHDRDQNYIGRFDVGTVLDDGFLVDRYPDFTVSADGSLVYARERNSSYGYQSLRIVARDPNRNERDGYKYSTMELEPVFSGQRQSVRCVADPQNALVAEGKELKSATLSERLGEFEFPVMCFLPRSPWVCGVADGKLYVGSVNDKRTVVAVQLPADFVPPEPVDQRGQTYDDWLLTNVVPPIRVFADADRGRIVVTTRDRAAVIDVKSLHLPDEPLLTMGLEGAKSFSIGKSTDLKVKSYDDRVTTRLVSAPVGMEWKGDTIRWTPADVDIGDATLIVERKFDRFRFEQTFVLPVRRDFVPLPMPARYVSLSPDGKLAVIWSQSRDSSQGDAAYSGNNLAVVDTTTGAVRAVKAIEKKIWSARVDASGVYLMTMPTSEGGNASTVEVLRLVLDDLSLASTIDVTLGGIDMSYAMEPVAGKVLLTGRDRFSLPDMQKLPSDGTAFDRLVSMAYASRVAYPLANGWMFDGVVWQGDLKTAEMLYCPVDFMGLGSQMRAWKLTPWGRKISSNQIEVSPGKTLLQTGGYDFLPVISNVAPVALALRTSEQVNRQPATVINAFDLVNGREAWQIVLLRGEGGNTTNYGAARESSLDTAGEMIAACADGKLFLVPFAEIQPAVLPRPFRFRLAQSPLVLAANGMGAAKYELLDGEPPFDVKLSIGEYRLRESTSNVVSFQINGRRVAADLLDRVPNEAWPTNAPGVSDERERAIDYIDDVTPEFRKIAGRDPNGVPMLVPVTIEATDKQLRTARLDHVFLMELPTGRVVERKTNPNSEYSNPYRERLRNEPEANAAEADAKRQQRLAEVNRELAVDYADELRKDNPPDKITEERWARQAARGRKASDAMLTRFVQGARDARMREKRTWSDRKGHTTEAQMKTAFADQVVLLVASGNEVTVPINKLSDADQAFIDESRQDEFGNEGDRMLGQMQFLQDAIARHIRRENGYPPAYIVDINGNSLLSWRVALLPDLGEKDLFSLFHFDEPWNGPNNARLLTYMPAVFAAAGSEPTEDRTRFLAFRTEDTVLSDGHPLSPREIKNPFGAAVFGEVIEARAAKWTAPDDLSDQDLPRLVEVLRDRNGQCLVGVSNQTIRTLPIGMNEGEWRRAVSRSIRTPLTVQFADPQSALAAAKPEAAADVPRVEERSASEIDQDRRIRNVDLYGIDENSPVGALAGQLVWGPSGCTYRIIDGTGSDTFELDAATGEMKVKDNSRLDFERHRTLALRVEAVSSGEPLPPRDVEIDLRDVNEPLVLGKQEPLEIQETAIKGSLVGQIAVSDPDGQPLQMTITSGNNHGAFETDGGASRLIVANEGALRKLAGLGPRPLTIQIDDGSGTPVKAMIVVNVTKAPEPEVQDAEPE